MALLEYENEILLDACHENGLLLMARGLGIERVFTNFLRLYCDPGNLVLVLNTSHAEEDYFISQLERQGIKPLPKVITAECVVNNRYAMYMEGGVIFVTSRILVVDLLMDRVPADLITGILVYRSHRILESCQEAFILRLYRQKNKTGFIKAFSDNPQSFTSGFCHIERVMKSLFVRKLFLWPRFQALVVSAMDRHKIDVVELHIQMTPLMVSCQTALLDLISACIKEVKRCNPSLDTDEMTVEYAITRGFDKIVKLHLDPVWNQLGFKTRQLISDIKTLRLLMEYLTQYDCVNFYNLVNSIRSNEKAFGQNNGWFFMDAADNLFVNAKMRVYGQPKTKRVKTDASYREEKVYGEPVLEECPKWAVLKEVLEEINQNIKEEQEEDGKAVNTERVLIAAHDDQTCNQIKEYLCEGGCKMLERMFKKTIALKSVGNRAVRGRGRGSNEKCVTKGASVNPIAKNEMTLTQMIDPVEEDNNKGEEKAEGNQDNDLLNGLTLTSSDAYYGILPSPVTILHPLNGLSNPLSLIYTLDEVCPRYVILYDADMIFVRQLEVYKATHPGQQLRVYFLMYTGSTEEQRYLTTLRKEKEAFEYLIRQKATMVIPEERDGCLEDDPNLSRDVTPANATTNSRKGGLGSNATRDKIVVDMREFRSELPSLLHRRGIDIEPLTIEVGDYILTPDICVERKSVSDLIGSLNNGRLYNQCVAMCKHYKRPVLLIEFDANKPFSLQGKYSLSSEINSMDTASRLTLLMLHFPRLRILWCQSPYATAELFQKLKSGRAQPDATKAMAISAEEDSEIVANKYAHTPQSLLLKMPGITSRNVYSILNHVENMAELVSIPEERLAEILGSVSHARLLHNFIHKESSPGVEGSDRQNKIEKKSLLKGLKRRR